MEGVNNYSSIQKWCICHLMTRIYEITSTLSNTSITEESTHFSVVMVVWSKQAP